MRRETISAIRFGFGLSPNNVAATNAENLIEDAQVTAERSPRISLESRVEKLAAFRVARQQGEDARKAAQRRMRGEALKDVRGLLASTVSDPGFGARLTSFWSDHFSVAANGPLLSLLVPDFIESAIRPHITKSFPEMLSAAVKHPAMLIYLNQVQSVGPNSRAGRRRERGLNENLAREILELHTLGVGAAYTQSDVRNFAELLTGLSVDKGGFLFRPGISEPGPHAFLGEQFGGPRATLDHIEDALHNISLRTETAHHLAEKLLTHFVGEQDEALVRRMSNAYLASKGDLSELYAAMLEDEFVWRAQFKKAKLPFEFMVSALRAAGTAENEVYEIRNRDLRRGIVEATQMMGQPLFRPPGPDGWSEDPADWITPPGLAARIRWATAFAERIEESHDPRLFLEAALGDAASETLRFAVGGSESRIEGIALTLASPEFNRR